MNSQNNDKDNLKITPQTIVATIMLAIGLINLGCQMFGFTPIQISEAELYPLVSYAFVVFPAIYAWWHNNSFTKPAIIGDQVKDAVKEMETSETVIGEVITIEDKNKEINILEKEIK